MSIHLVKPITTGDLEEIIYPPLEPLPATITVKRKFRPIFWKTESYWKNNRWEENADQKVTKLFIGISDFFQADVFNTTKMGLLKSTLMHDSIISSGALRDVQALGDSGNSICRIISKPQEAFPIIVELSSFF